jgi:uncharacterized protein (TIGR03000 family)
MTGTYYSGATYYPAGTTVYPAGTQYEYRSGYAVPNGERRMDRRDADRSETERRNSDRSSDTERRTPDTGRGPTPNLERAPGDTPPSAPKTPPATPDKPGATPDKPPPEARADSPATIIVRLPADAQLRIDDQPTRSTSEQRTFLSPPLPAGRNFVYTLQADAVRNGAPVTVRKEVTVRAGEETRVTLDFSPPTVAQQ